MSPAARPRADIFLCHNAADKTLVREVAEGLELEFGLPHFLDIYSIPTGEAFRPWIEEALATAKGCAIFLGANGWGATHLWEAELALARYRRDPTFVLIPVALPGIRESDMRRLGDGTLFSERNFADLRQGVVDPYTIGKLRAALLGQPHDVERARAALTPYQVRRDAQRWKRNRRLLYRGYQLREAEDLRSRETDLLSTADVAEFLTASARGERRRLQRMIALALLALVAAAGAIYLIDWSRRQALASLFAAEARQAGSPDTALLLAVHAATIAPSATSEATMLERLDAVPHLQRMLRVGKAEVTSLAFDVPAEHLYVGHADGTIARVALADFTAVPLPRISTGVVSQIVIAPGSDQQWVGLQDGRVMRHSPSGWRVVGRFADRGPAPPAVNRRSLGPPITALAVDACGRHVAAADHAGALWVLDASDGRELWAQSFATSAQVRALDFSHDCGVLAVGHANGLVRWLTIDDGSEAGTYTTATTGHALALAFARDGSLRAFDDGGFFHVLVPGEASQSRRWIDGDLFAVAALGPRREFGPERRKDQLVVGYGYGELAFVPLLGSVDRPVHVRAHAGTVTASALASTGTMAASGADDGTVAVFDLTRRLAVQRPLGPVAGYAAALAGTDDGDLWAVAVSSESAALLRRAPGDAGWSEVRDLLAWGGEPAPAPPVADADGFVPIPDPAVTAGFSPDGRRVAWLTQSGRLLQAEVGGDAAKVVATGLPTRAHLRLGDDHVDVAAGERLVRHDLDSSGTRSREIRLPAGVRDLAASPDKSLVVVALDDDHLGWIDLTKQPPRVTSRASGLSAISALDVLDDSGRTVASGNGPGGVEVRVFERDRERVVRVHTRRVAGAVAMLTHSSAADLLIASDMNGSVHLWRLSDLAPLASVSLSSASIDHLAIASAGRRLALIDHDGGASELTLDPADWRKSACAIAGRELDEQEWSALAPGEPDPVCVFRAAG